MTQRKFIYISRDGTALNEKGQEITDSTGAVIVVPEEERSDYDLAYRAHEEPTDDE
jgi:hypothetical protein